MVLSEGSVFYFGTPNDSLQYLRQHNLACPDGNAADYLMDTLMNEGTNVSDTDSVVVSPSAVEDDIPATSRNQKGEDSYRHDAFSSKLGAVKPWRNRWSGR